MNQALSEEAPCLNSTEDHRFLQGLSAVRGRGGGDGGGTDREGAEETKTDQKLVSFFFLFLFSPPARLERNELWNCDFPFFVLFNIKPYLLYWKLQRILSLMISEFHKAHIKVSLQNTSSCLHVFFSHFCT